MSNKLYLVCLSHDPEQFSDVVAGDLNGITRLRRLTREDEREYYVSMIEHKGLVATIGRMDFCMGNLVEFIAKHPRCAYALQDDRGYRYSAIYGDDNQAPSSPFCGRNRRSHLDFLGCNNPAPKCPPLIDENEPLPTYPYNQENTMTVNRLMSLEEYAEAIDLGDTTVEELDNLLKDAGVASSRRWSVLHKIYKKKREASGALFQLQELERVNYYKRSVIFCGHEGVMTDFMPPRNDSDERYTLVIDGRLIQGLGRDEIILLPGDGA